VKSSLWISCDESMSVWKPCKTKLEGLWNISFIIRKHKPIGKKRFNLLSLFYFCVNSSDWEYYDLLILRTKFKTAACPITGVVHHIEIQCGKERIKSVPFNSEVGATTET
jgi:hypothetical protein